MDSNKDSMEQAYSLIEADKQQRIAAATQEINEILIKYNCKIVPVINNLGDITFNILNTIVPN